MYLSKASPGGGGARGPPSAADPDGASSASGPRPAQSPGGGGPPGPGKQNKKRKAPTLRPRQDGPPSHVPPAAPAPRGADL
eukprot:9336670-Lingulodinium_polyedra.AAC.1